MQFHVLWHANVGLDGARYVRAAEAGRALLRTCARPAKPMFGDAQNHTISSWLEFPSFGQVTFYIHTPLSNPPEFQ